MREFSSSAELLAHYAGVKERLNAGPPPAPPAPPAPPPEPPPPRRELVFLPSPCMNVSKLAIRALMEHFNLSKTELLAQRRPHATARIRQIGMYVAHLAGGQSYPMIGRTFGNRDHTTVMHGVRKIRELLAREPPDATLVADVAAIAARVQRFLQGVS